MDRDMSACALLTELFIIHPLLNFSWIYGYKMLPPGPCSRDSRPGYDVGGVRQCFFMEHIFSVLFLHEIFSQIQWILCKYFTGHKICIFYVIRIAGIRIFSLSEIHHNIYLGP
jgi:hypothetical protein